MGIGDPLQVIDQLKAFWRWWLGELAGFVPRRVADFFAAGTAVIRVEEMGDAARFVLEARRGERPLGEIDLRNAAQSELQAFGRKVQAGLGARPRVELFPAAHAFLSREVQLPLAVENTLPTVMGYEIDKLMPFRKGEAVFGWLPHSPALSRTAETRGGDPRHAVGAVVASAGGPGCALAAPGRGVAPRRRQARSGRDHEHAAPFAAERGGTVVEPGGMARIHRRCGPGDRGARAARLVSRAQY